MTDKISQEDLPIVEVPAELRGLSDDEILALHPVDEEKRDRFRPSKKEREAKKLAKEQERIRKIAEQYEKRNSFNRSSRPMPKMSDYENRFMNDNGAHYSSSPRRFDQNFSSETPFRSQNSYQRSVPPPRKPLFVPSQIKKMASAPNPVMESKPASALPPRQSSGRVLVGSFGSAKFGATQTEIISEADLAKKRAEEEAKRQQEIVRKHLAEAALAAQKAALAAAAASGVQPGEAIAEKPELDLSALFKPGSALAVAGAAAAAAGVSLRPMQIGPDGKPVPVKRKRGRPRKYPRPEDLIG